jgi:hypothetical protein
MSEFPRGPITDSNGYPARVFQDYIEAIERAPDLAFGAAIVAADAETTPNNADILAICDSTAAYILKKITWANTKATLKTYFDTLYLGATGEALTAAKWATARTLAGNSVDGSANVPFTNKVIVQGTVDAGLTGAQFLGALTTGLVKNTTTTGILSIAEVGVDYIAPPAPIVGATKTKITYDTQGLVTVGEDATTADIADSVDARYVTDAEKTAIASIAGLAITAGKTLTVQKTMTLTCADDTAVVTFPAGAHTMLATDGSAASLTDFPTLNQNTSGTAAGLSGTPALPDGTTATTQAAADNSTKVATTAYVDTGLGTKVSNSLFDANTVLYATLDDTPAALTVTEESVVGRVTGGAIAALVLGVAAGNVMKAPADPAAHTLFGFDNTGNIYRPILIGTGLSYDQPTNTISSSGGGVTAHSDLTELAYGDAAHTGFQVASFVNVKDPAYGAVGDGVTDDTTAIQNACNVGGSVYFPAGTYKVSSAITLGVAGTYYGAGRKATTMSTTSATADIFNITVDGVHVEAMGFASSATRTAGYCINASATVNFCSVANFYMAAPFYGVHLTWAGGHVKDGEMMGIVQDGVGIVVDTNGVSEIENVGFVGPATFDVTDDATAEAYGGIVITACMQMYISHCNFNCFYYPILLAPSGGGIGVVEAVYVTDCVMDANRYGMYLGTALAGSHIANTQLTNVWLVTNTFDGIRFVTSSGGKIKNTLMNHCHILHNYGHGVNVGAGTTDLRISDSFINSNGMTSGSGIYLGSGVSNFSIIGNHIGATEFTGGNGRYGIEYGGSNTDGTIIGNDLLGNTLGTVSGAPSTNFVNLGNLTAASGITFGIPFSATSKILGRKTAGAGDAEELSAADVNTILGTVVGSASSSDGNIPKYNGTTGKLITDSGYNENHFKGCTTAANRAYTLGTTYTNNTGKALWVAVSVTSATIGEASTLYIGQTTANLTAAIAQIKAANYYETAGGWVPIGWKYMASGGGGLTMAAWFECY